MLDAHELAVPDRRVRDQLVAAIGAASADPRTVLLTCRETGLSTALALQASTPPPAEARSCCKICRKGCACGNTCISCQYTCHQPPGCACDG